jgi:hypothetical protein
MPSTDSLIALSAEQIADLNKRLSVMRHNVNNHLSMVVAACELIRRKPELATRMLENIGQQPEKITDELRQFSEAVEKILGFSHHAPSLHAHPQS